MNIKRDPADVVFSQYVRLRDGWCQRCSSRVSKNEKGMPISHEASHYFGRGKENTRFEPDNVDCLCTACHRIWGSDEREAYRRYMIAKLGETRFKALEIQSNTYCKKDRKLALLKAKELLKSVLIV